MNKTNRMGFIMAFLLIFWGSLALAEELTVNDEISLFRADVRHNWSPGPTLKCPTCVKEKKKSKVYPGISQTTLSYTPPFYDEEGAYHNHDANTTTTPHKCSNGHEWELKSHHFCWCGWPKRKEVEKRASEQE